MTPIGAVVTGAGGVAGVAEDVFDAAEDDDFNGAFFTGIIAVGSGVLGTLFPTEPLDAGIAVAATIARARVEGIAIGIAGTNKESPKQLRRSCSNQ